MQAAESFRLFLITVLFLLLAGCGQLPDRPDRPGADPDEIRAASLMQTGQFAEAESLYLQLAARTAIPSQKARHLLDAAEAARANGNWDGVRGVLTQLAPMPLGELQALHRKLLTAELRLQENLPAEALAALGPGISPETPVSLQLRFYRDQADGYRQIGGLLESARALQALDALLDDPLARLENQHEILRTLALMNERELLDQQPSPPGIGGGWMQLALLAKEYGTDPERLALQFDEWRTRFPLHPALPELLSDYQQQLLAQMQVAGRIAVLLPQTGALANVSTAIHDGMMISWYAMAEDQRPEIRFYDATDPMGIWPLYTQAVADGAELVVGPLQKDAVTQLLRAGELPVPVMALNQVALETAPADNFFMYSLSPEDEARQAAERAWSDGKRRPVILSPEGVWGDRLAQAFESRWLSLGGSVAATGRYDGKSHDYSETIKQALQIDSSIKRRRQLEGWLGRKLEFEPRRRGDIDAVFLAARPVQAQGIRPQLQFHHAADLPIYATSHAWLGKLTRTQVEDMQGVLLADIPWLVDPENDEARATAARQLPQSGTAYSRLYAMGMDAMQLVPHLNRLRSSRYESLDGMTGNLYMDETNQIHRQLVWVELGETTRVLGYSPRLDLQGDDSEAAPTGDFGVTPQPITQ